jgi:hypothetical protein
LTFCFGIECSIWTWLVRHALLIGELDVDDFVGELFFSKPFGALDGSPEAKEYAHMIDFCFANFLMKDIAKPVLTLLKISKSFIPKALRDLAISGDYVADVSNKLSSNPDSIPNINPACEENIG